jgi:hypothetical protein
MRKILMIAVVMLFAGVALIGCRAEGEIGDTRTSLTAQ